MAEFTELFPMGQQLDGLLHMYVYIIKFDLPTVITICIVVILFFFILYQIFNGLFYWFIVMRRNEHDVEEGITHLAYGASEQSHHVTVFHDLVQSNLQAWTMMAAFETVFEENQGQKLRALKILPPLVNYGRHEVVRCCDSCTICLEEFQDGQFCQVLPVCKHIFHSDCLDHWLRKKLNCPICRNCI